MKSQEIRVNVDAISLIGEYTNELELFFSICSYKIGASYFICQTL